MKNMINYDELQVCERADSGGAQWTFPGGMVKKLGCIKDTLTQNCLSLRRHE